MPLSAAEAGRVFFLHEDVAFVEPTPELRALRPGDPVAFSRANGTMAQAGAGEVFRVREEHVAIRILDGAVRVGDAARPAQGAIDAGARIRPSVDIPPPTIVAPSTTAGGTKPPTAAGENTAAVTGGPILVYRLGNAPRILAGRFDSDLVRSLLKESSNETGFSIRIADRPRGGRITAARVRRDARRLGAAIVLVPDYHAGDGGDSIVVGLYDPETGRRIGSAATPVRLFDDLVFLPDGRRIGALEFIGRYEGLTPQADDLRLDARGRPVVRVAGDWFRLEDGEARFLSDGTPPRRGGTTTRLADGRRIALTIVTTPGGHERIEIHADDRLLYATSPMRPGVVVGLRDDRFALMEQGILKLYRLTAERAAGENPVD